MNKPPKKRIGLPLEPTNQPKRKTTTMNEELRERARAMTNEEAARAFFYLMGRIGGGLADARLDAATPEITKAFAEAIETATGFSKALETAGPATKGGV